jgi:hypothetical protein
MTLARKCWIGNPRSLVLDLVMDHVLAMARHSARHGSGCNDVSPHARRLYKDFSHHDHPEAPRVKPRDRGTSIGGYLF